MSPIASLDDRFTEDLEDIQLLAPVVALKPIEIS